MSELGIALIAAGSALAGGALTGWFTRSAGQRQAEAARHAGDRQADALLHTVQATLDEQRRARVEEHRRSAYSGLLMAVEELENEQPPNHGMVTERPRATGYELRTAVMAAMQRVRLEGPMTVVLAGSEMVACAMSPASARGGRLDMLRRRYVEAAQAALGIAGDRL
ncbi:hypothetical protein PV350_23575 [Streptomyces sp. PA03-6a]|nr:hypothetical protein [Streptomyces sp. PA03-6a]